MCPITRAMPFLQDVPAVARDRIPAAIAVADSNAVVTTGPANEVLWMLNDAFLGGLIVMMGAWAMLAIFFVWNLADLVTPYAIARRLKARITLGTVIATATAAASRNDHSRRQAAFISQAFERQQLLRPDPTSTPEPELKIFMPHSQEMCEMERGAVKGKMKSRGIGRGKRRAGMEVEMVELVPAIALNRV